MITPGDPTSTWDDTTAEQISRAVFDHGWGRVRPDLVLILLCSLAIARKPMTEQDLTRHFGLPHWRQGWSVPCWEPVEHLTDEGVAALRVEFPDDFGSETAAELNAEADAERRAAITETARYAAHYGLPPLDTCRDVLDLLVAAGAIHRVNGLLSPAHPLPRVADVFPVSPGERQVLADLPALLRGEQPEDAS